MTLPSFGSFGFSFFGGHRRASSSLIFTRVCVQFIASEMTNVVRVTHGALRGRVKTSRFGALGLSFSVMDVVVGAMRHTFKIGEVVVARVAVYVVDMESARDWSMCGFPYESVLVRPATINHESFVAV